MPSRRGFLAAMAAAVTAYTLGGAATSASLEITRVSAGIGVKTLLLTDLHIHAKKPTEVVKAVKRIKPRLLLVAGDSWDERTPRGAQTALQTLEELLEAVHEAALVYGNHEYAARNKVLDLNTATGLLKHMGYRVLRDQAETLTGLKICGLDWHPDPAAYKNTPRGCDIVLVHTPDAFHYADPETPTLYLAGHTHGGQWCLPGAIPVITNSRYGYTWGYYRKGEAQMYVSRGLGEMIPPRLYCPYQLVMIQ